MKGGEWRHFSCWKVGSVRNEYTFSTYYIKPVKSQWKGQRENARYKKSPQITIKTTGDMTVRLIYGTSRRRLRHPEARLHFADCHILPARSAIDKWDVNALKLSRKLPDWEVLNFLKNDVNVWLPNQASSLTTSLFLHFVACRLSFILFCRQKSTTRFYLGNNACKFSGRRKKHIRSFSLTIERSEKFWVSIESSRQW